MINLLSQKDKDKLLIEKNKKVAAIICFLVLFFLVYLIIALFVVKVHSNGQLSSDKLFLEKSQKQFLQSEIQDLQDKVELANVSFNELNSFYQRKVYFSKALQDMATIFPKDFYLTNFSIALNIKEKKEGEEVIRTIRSSLSGLAPTREGLLFFKERLEEESSFENIFFPISNWASKENINFYITFDIPI